MKPTEDILGLPKTLELRQELDLSVTMHQRHRFTANFEIFAGSIALLVLFGPVWLFWVPFGTFGTF